MGTPGGADVGRLGAAVGRYTYTVTEDRWSWSSGIYELYGYAPGDASPSTEVLLGHVHPDDMDRTLTTLERAVHDGDPFSCYHRIVTCKQQVRSALLVGHGVRGGEGHVREIVGYLVDSTQARRAEVQAEVDLALSRIAENRPVIDQAKGVLMFAAGCGADEAFDLLRHYSSSTNLKLNEVARRLVEAVGPRLRANEESCAEILAHIEAPLQVNSVA
jgi:ANTAR domain/PAS fold